MTCLQDEYHALQHTRCWLDVQLAALEVVPNKSPSTPTNKWGAPKKNFPQL
jgi:hypothetical protein